MENQSLYRIIFEGRIRAGEDPGQVRARLSSLFKAEPAAIEKVFRDAPTVIQQNLPEEKALKYKTTFEQTGALCRVEKEPTMYQPERAPEPAPDSTPEPRQQVIVTGTGAERLTRDAWKAMGIGAVITAVILYFPFLSFVFRYMITLVHEIGHAVFGWFFGYPSVPAFDFAYGGGITMHQDRKMIIVIIIYVLLAALFYFYRRNHLTLVLLLAVTTLYSAAAFTDIHSIVILFMGHGTELIFGAIFFYRGLSGSSVIVSAERPLYAFLGFFIFFIDIRFAHRLMSSAAHRAEYEAAKGGGHWMDFSRIAENYLHTKLSSIASLFLLLCLITPFITYLFFRYGNTLFDLFYRLLTPKPGTRK